VIDTWPDYTSDHVTDCPYYCPFTFCMLFQSYFSIYFLYLLTCYMHVRLPLYSYTFTRSFDSLNLHIQICGYLLLNRYLERITYILRSWSPLAWHPFSIFSCFFLYSYCFHDSMHWTHACSIPLFICYHVCSFICYCSDIDLS